MEKPAANFWQLQRGDNSRVIPGATPDLPQQSIANGIRGVCLILFSEKVTAMAQNFLRHFHFWSFFPVDRSIRAAAAQIDETAIFSHQSVSILAALKIRSRLTQNRHPFFVIMPD